MNEANSMMPTPAHWRGALGFIAGWTALAAVVALLFVGGKWVFLVLLIVFLSYIVAVSQPETQAETQAKAEAESALWEVKEPIRARVELTAEHLGLFPPRSDATLVELKRMDALFETNAPEIHADSRARTARTTEASNG